VRRLSRNLLAISGSDIGRRLIGFFTIAYLARKLGAADFGVISIGFTVLSYAIMATAGGLNSYGAREIAKGDSLLSVNSLLSLRLVGSIAAYGVVALVAVMLITDPLIAKVILISGIAVFAHALTVEWFFQGREAMGMIGVGRLVSAAVYLSLVLLLVRGPEDLLWVAAAAVTGDFVAAAVMLTVYRRRTSARFSFETIGWLPMVRQSLKIGIGSMLGHFSINLPPLVLGIMLSTGDVGIYSAAQRMVFFLLMLDRVTGTLLLPAAARLHSFSPESLSATLSSALRWILIAAVPLVLGGTILAEAIIRLVFGTPFAAAGEIFRIFIWYFLLTMIHTIYTSGLVAIRQETRYSRVMIVSAALYAVTIIVATKFYGTIGTVFAVVISEAVTMMLMRRELQQFVKIRLPKSIFAVFIAAAVMCSVLIGFHFPNVILAVGCGGAAYIAVLFAARGVTTSDIAELAGRLT